MIDFEQYLPQRTFLAQGKEKTFNELFGAFAANDPMTSGLSVPRFTIEHARSIVSFNLEGAGSSRTFIVYFSIFSPDAAQVLLKTLEEPDEYTRFIFVTPYPYLVPPTIRSRVMLIPTIEKRDTKTKAEILEEIKKEASSKDDDAATRRARAVTPLDSLEGVLVHNPKDAAYIYKAKDMLFTANLPTKYVLDYIATVIS